MKRFWLGAALLAGIGVGLYADKEEAASMVRPDLTFHPAMAQQDRELEAREKIYMNAFLRYGEVHRAVVAMEELRECQKEIAKFIRGIGNAGDLAEEVADALICLEEMMIYGIREMEQIQMDRKIMRLEDDLRREAMRSEAAAEG